MTQLGVPPKQHLPRDSAGRIELQGGTGGITAMCSCAEFLEVYKEDVTFRVRTPESIDPDRPNPNARMVAALPDDVGSSSPAVARILLQGCEILEATLFDRPVDNAAVVMYSIDKRFQFIIQGYEAERVIFPVPIGQPSPVSYILTDITPYAVT